MIIVGHNTILSGYVLRWYRDTDEAIRGNARMSASRDGVLIECWLHEIPTDQLDLARGAHMLLRRGGETELKVARSYATHTTALFGGRAVLPVERKDS
jgi:hypothetical protein